MAKRTYTDKDLREILQVAADLAEEVGRPELAEKLRHIHEDRYRVVWEDDPDPDLSWLEQWNTPERYYDVPGWRHPNRHPPQARWGRNNGVVFEDGHPLNFDEYSHGPGAPENREVLMVRVERQVGGRDDWEIVGSLGGIDFSINSHAYTGTLEEYEIHHELMGRQWRAGSLIQQAYQYQYETSLEMINAAKAGGR